MVGFYNYTVWLTYLGLISGVTGVVFAANGNPFAAVICLIISGVCDMFDGRIARTRKRNEQEKEFGIQIDSLCDLVSFGVLPPMICFSLGLTQWYHMIVYALFVLAAVIRLAYYNVKEHFRSEQEEKVYYGLPVTNSSIIFPLIYILSRFFQWGKIVYFVFLIVVMLLFVLKFKMKKAKAWFLIVASICAILAVLFLILVELNLI